MSKFNTPVTKRKRGGGEYTRKDGVDENKLIQPHSLIAKQGVISAVLDHDIDAGFYRVQWESPDGQITWEPSKSVENYERGRVSGKLIEFRAKVAKGGEISENGLLFRYQRGELINLYNNTVQKIDAGVQTLAIGPEIDFNAIISLKQTDFMRDCLSKELCWEELTLFTTIQVDVIWIEEEEGNFWTPVPSPNFKKIKTIIKKYIENQSSRSFIKIFEPKTLCLIPLMRAHHRAEILEEINETHVLVFLSDYGIRESIEKNKCIEMPIELYGGYSLGRQIAHCRLSSLYAYKRPANLLKEPSVMIKPIVKIDSGSYLVEIENGSPEPPLQLGNELNSFKSVITKLPELPVSNYLKSGSIVVLGYSGITKKPYVEVFGDDEGYNLIKNLTKSLISSLEPLNDIPSIGCVVVAPSNIPAKWERGVVTLVHQAYILVDLIESGEEIKFRVCQLRWPNETFIKIPLRRVRVIIDGGEQNQMPGPVKMTIVRGRQPKYDMLVSLTSADTN